MEPQLHNGRHGKQVAILAILIFLLCVIVYRPTIRLAIQVLFPRPPLQLGSAELSIPRTWMLSRNPARVNVWKPCRTIFCDSSQASFILKVEDLPDDVWEHAAMKILRDEYSAETARKTLYGRSGQIKCVELNSTLADGRIVSACMISDLHLTSTFVGIPILRPTFYSILATAHKIP